jgi:tripartite-type tricarboxylate transporter receptor subunit TctC
MIASVPFVLVVPAASEVRSMADLLDAANRKPGGLSYGSAGNGSPQHLAAELFKAATGAELRHFPYGGSAAALGDVLSGQLDLMFADLAPALGHIRGDRLRALGVTSRGRQSTLPEVASIAEGSAELSRFEAVAWQSLVAPAGTPSALTQRIGLALRQVLDQPPTRDRLQREGVEPRTSTADELAAAIRSDTERWAKLIKAARISIG